ncbi:hypothetical protein Pst134EB_027493 [Puccinia striiformis f. sp. tritici]|nr:hypothetical protein Pst134EB_027493 [Puccinia striiformis f. sp. tritici]
MKSNTNQLDPSLFQLSAEPSKDTSTAAEIQPLTAPAPIKSSSTHKTPVKPTRKKVAAKKVALGEGTDNSNLNGEGWSQVAKEMKAEFGIEFQIEHLKNQKNDLRKIFINTEFL